MSPNDVARARIDALLLEIEVLESNMPPVVSDLFATDARAALEMIRRIERRLAAHPANDPPTSRTGA